MFTKWIFPDSWQIITIAICSVLNQRSAWRMSIIIAGIIFANDGLVYMPMRAIPQPDERGLKVFTKGGSTRINSLTVHELKSIWN